MNIRHNIDKRPERIYIFFLALTYPLKTIIPGEDLITELYSRLEKCCTARIMEWPTAASTSSHAAITVITKESKKKLVLLLSDIWRIRYWHWSIRDRLLRVYTITFLLPVLGELSTCQKCYSLVNYIISKIADRAPMGPNVP